MAIARTLSPDSHQRNVVVLGAIAALILFWRLGAGSLAPWDEAIYAQVSKEMARGEGWLTLHWAYQPWFEKPPLFMWTTALFYRLFGVSEFWARSVAAISGIGLVATTYFLGAFVYSKRVGIFAALVLLTCYHFLSFSRFGTMEVMLSLFTYLAISGYLRLKDGNGKWWYVVWICIALALLVKGAGGLIAFGVVLLAVIFDGRAKSAVQSRHFWLGCLLALGLVVPWHALMYAWYGRAFVDEYIRYHVIARSIRTLEGHPSSYFYYLGKLIDGFFPWALVLPFALIGGVRKAIKGDSSTRLFLVTGALVLGLYSIVPTRRPWYIVPAYPAFAILIAAFLIRFYEARKTSPSWRRMIILGCVLLIAIGASYCALSLSLNRKPEDSLAKLSRMAQSRTESDRDPLLLFNESEPMYAQVPVFYSDRPVRQAYISEKPVSEDSKRYLNYEDLSNLTSDSTRRIILPKTEVARLSANYEINVLAEINPLVYATIRRKG